MPNRKAKERKMQRRIKNQELKRAKRAKKLARKKENVL